MNLSTTVAGLFGVRHEKVIAEDGHVRIASHAYRIDRDVVLLDERVVRDSTQREAGEDVRRSFASS